MSHLPLLQAQQITKAFGGLVALKETSLNISRQEILGLIGPNGAGKTTLFNVIAGALTPDAGTILYEGEDITKTGPDRRCQLGIARTFQITRPFLNLSLLDNITVGAYFGKKRGNLQAAKKKAAEVLEFLSMGDLQHQEAKQLSIGNRKKLELARALATNPKLLLLDEVMGGLTPTEAAEMMEIIRSIRESGVTIIMIEHVMKAAMGLSDRIMVLHYGQAIAEGTPVEIAQNPLVIEAYLGGMKHA
ncbi:ABC transporter ATP-binding protein [Brevibacillus sp. B_LB10_24]|uniref:ABC transporter ATP-binding protein n=1 Tax=Brevibacillus sp. B_LB10_24 TaxID=3380645 RepID=UPI0038B6BFDC